MQEQFNPYLDWLQIPLQELPPNHYRLLGLARFEGDTETISRAADERMKLLRSFQTGIHARESQQLLNEISAARLCLLDALARREYDRVLAQQIAALNLPSIVPEPELVPPEELPMRAPDHIRRAIPADPARLMQPYMTRSEQVKSGLHRWILPTVAGLIAVLALVVALIWYSVQQ